MSYTFIRTLVLACAFTFAMASGAWAAGSDDIASRIDILEQELQSLKESLKTVTQQATEATQEAKRAKKEAKKARAEAVEERDTATKWHLAGYGDVSFRASDLDSEETSFLGGTLVPIFHFQYEDLLMFEGELEIETESDGSTKVALEYSTLDLILDDNLTVVAGKFLSPLGQFQERLHPSWINKAPDRPSGFAGSNGALPLSDLGVMVRGGAYFDPMMINYSLYSGNGPQLELTGGVLEKVELEGFGSDDNGPKSFGGRIGVLPVPYVELGGSYMTSKIKGKKVAGVAGDLTAGDYTFWGVDAAYTRGYADLRFEYFSSELDTFFSQSEAATATAAVDKTDWEAWYAQAAYQLSGITDLPILKNLEPVIRYSQFSVKGFEEFVAEGKPEDKLTVGLNYLFALSLVWKNAISMRDFRNAGAQNSTEYRTQLAYGF
ncbi:MAG: hypothetical protein HOM52_15965 [Rhodospirillaceae bacterium]|nr:hypothetical protein [Rhodospirillaceae bacterium]